MIIARKGDSLFDYILVKEYSDASSDGPEQKRTEQTDKYNNIIPVLLRQH